MKSPFSKYVLLLFLAVSACMHFVFSQERLIQFDNFGKQYNFENTVVCHATQDSIGFIWFATHSGLYRYDGRSFIIFRNIQNDSTSLPNDWVNEVYPMHNGDLWVGTRGGIAYYQHKTQRFVQFHTANSSLSNNDVYAISIDSRKRLWLGTLNGLNCITLKWNNNNEVKFEANEIYLPDSSDKNAISNNNIYSIIFDKNGYGWIGTAEGINRFNPQQSIIKFEKYFNTSDSHSLSNNLIWKLIPDKDKIWVVSVADGLDYFYPDSALYNSGIKFNRFLPSLKSRTGINMSPNYYLLHDSKNNYWLATQDKGVLFFSLNAKMEIASWQYLINEKGDNGSLVSNSTWHAFEDKEKNIWISTWDGISKFNYSRFDFQHFDFDKTSFNIYDQNINCVIAAGSNHVLAGGDNNELYLLGKDHSRIIPLQLANGNFKKAILKTTSFLIDKAGNLYVGTQGNALFLDSRKCQKMLADKTYNPVFDTINNRTNTKTNFIMSMALRRNGNVVFGTGRGLIELDTSTKNVTALYFGDQSQHIIRCVAEDPTDGSIWMGSDNGLHQLKNNKINTYKQSTDASSISSNTINAICFDGENKLWIATSNGLNKFEGNSRFKKYIITDDAYSVNILSIVPDRNGNIWCGTENGLAKFVVSENIFKRYNISDGLFSNKFNASAASVSDNGVLLFGSNKGFNSLQPEKIESNKSLPAIKIVDCKINDHSVFSDTTLIEQFKSFCNNQIVNLSYKQNFITIDYASLSFRNESKNQFKYKLSISGNDAEWIGPVDYTSARFSALQPGDYVFEVIASNNDGIWNLKPAVIMFSITPPWYQTTLFRITVAVILILIIIYVVRYLSQQKLKERLAEVEKLAALERERNRISRDLHDDLGAGLSSVAMMTSQIKELVTDEQAQDRAWEISNEANDLVSRMREIIWSMSSKNDSLENLIAYINKYAATYLEKNYLQCIVWCNEDMPAVIINGDMRRNIFLVVKETLHNIIKHSGATEVVLHYCIENGFIKLQISDNGKGFDMANIHRFGNGLANMKQRMESAGGNYEITSKPGQGTATTLFIAIDESSKS